MALSVEAWGAETWATGGPSVEPNNNADATTNEGAAAEVKPEVVVADSDQEVNVPSADTAAAHVAAVNQRKEARKAARKARQEQREAKAREQANTDAEQGGPSTEEAAAEEQASADGNPSDYTVFEQGGDSAEQAAADEQAREADESMDSTSKLDG
ncbi:hypothetical protein LTR70_006990 [Exophiala xenobiotica]|uniref:Uncharacterized protein n=1 Tax=Lithohypha guttulata TaxID=1690604 RepID=A0ABR0K668_9EURO|nr:hypothetical protein LTR24_006469 [Lithohypha guttulata]KAK5314877.1 hypothetical protein LTR70_006990 [Exophiala xenobiotica]